MPEGKGIVVRGSPAELSYLWRLEFSSLEGVRVHTPGLRIGGE
jgi:hypothetical protein